MTFPLGKASGSPALSPNEHCTMYRFKVLGMSCSHCMSSIEKAVRTADGSAEIEIDLAVREVRVRTDREEGTIAEAIRSAGYEATSLPN